MIGNCDRAMICWCFATLWSLFPVAVAALQTRRSILLPWKSLSSSSSDDRVELGWVTEVRDDETKKIRAQVSHGSGESRESHAASPTTTVSLPYISEASSLASSLWPAGLAGAVLYASAASRNNNQPQAILELGCGLGLVGRILEATTPTAESIVMTDHDRDVLETLQGFLDSENTDNSNSPTIRSQFLEWRDEDLPSGFDAHSFDMVVGTDVAYYSFLLHPLAGTATRLLKNDEDSSLMSFVGQANRQTQWDLWHWLREGGNNPLTGDAVEAPFPDAQMLLYRLEMENWREAGNDTSTVDGCIPIAVVSASTSSATTLWTDHDYAATVEDEASIDISF